MCREIKECEAGAGFAPSALSLTVSENAHRTADTGTTVKVGLMTWPVADERTFVRWHGSGPSRQAGRKRLCAERWTRSAQTRREPGAPQPQPHDWFWLSDPGCTRTATVAGVMG